MNKVFKDKRLPKGIEIYLNSFDEYVAIYEHGNTVQIGNKNVAASDTLDGAINNYLDKKFHNPLRLIG